MNLTMNTFKYLFGIEKCCYCCEKHECKHDTKDKKPVIEINEHVRSRTGGIFSLQHFEGLKTLKDAFECGISISANRECLGWRSTLNEDYKWDTYAEVDKMVCHFGSALLHTTPHKDSETMICMIGPTSREWFVGQFACFSYNYVVVPVYESFGEDGKAHVLNQTSSTTVMCHTVKQAEEFIKIRKDELKHVIVCGRDENVDELKAKHQSTIAIHTFNEFLQIGKENPKPKLDPKPTDMCLICYTSGSTGIPKGVMITHEKLLGASFSILESFKHRVFCENSVNFAYLPYAHIFGQLTVLLSIMHGGRVGFITKDVRTMLDDLKSLKPTLLGVVPRVLTKVYEKVIRETSKSKFKSKLLEWVQSRALYRHKCLRFDQANFWDRLVFKRLQEGFGGNLRAITCGGAQLPDHVADLIQAAFDGRLIFAYGSTETMGIATLSSLKDYYKFPNGIVASRTQVKLGDLPDMDIFVNRDKRGEILVKADRCTDGYYKNPEANADLYTKDGWLRTGDIGMWNDDGTLNIIDRAKSVFKLSQGEYVAPEKCELIYSKCPLINQIIMEGCPTQNFPVGIVIPNFPELREMLKEANKEDKQKYDGMNEKDLCALSETKQVLLKVMTEEANNGGLNGYEKIKAIHVIDDVFTVENGFLTPTMKYARQKIRNHYRSTFEDLFKELESMK